MAQEHEQDGTDVEMNPIGTSLVGGFLGTVTGLKKGGAGGALIGGLVGGTAGYVAGAAAEEGSRPEPSVDVDPVTIPTGNEEDGDDADEADGEGGADEADGEGEVADDDSDATHGDDEAEASDDHEADE